MAVPVLGRSLGPARFRANVAVLAALTLAVAAFGGRAVWVAHQRSLDRAHRLVAERALATMALPRGIHHLPRGSAGCPTSADTLCASSLLTPAQLQPLVERLLRGSAAEHAPCLAYGTPAANGCRMVKGTVAGYPAVALVFPHLLLVRHGRPPAGSVPVHPGLRYAFFHGSDINVVLVSRDG